MILEMNEVCKVLQLFNNLKLIMLFLYSYITKLPDFEVNLISKYGLLLQYSLANI